MNKIRQFFIRHCRLYRMLICKLFGKYDCEYLTFPFALYGTFEYSYIGYNEKGIVKKGFCSLWEALKNKGDLGITTIY